MFVLDLRWVVFVLLAVITLLFSLFWWISRRNRDALVSPNSPTLESIMEQAPFGCVVFEDVSAYCYANPYAQRLLSLSSKSGYLPDAPWVQLLIEDRLAAQKGAMVAPRYRSSKLSDHSFVSWWVTSQGGKDIAFLFDTTSQQQGEELTRSVMNDLSHELRTPVATILTHLEVVSLTDVTEDVRKQSLQTMKQEATRVARLVHDLLELSRIETLVEMEKCPVDVLEVAHEAVMQTVPQVDTKGMRLSLEADSPLDLVVANRDRLKQVFLNLLDNSVKYGRPGDTITVSLHKAENSVECNVCDTGPGIPPQHLPHVARRFFRVNGRSSDGSGLGFVKSRA